MNKKDNAILRDRNDTLLIIFLSIGIITVIMGAVLIYDIAFGKPPTPPSKMSIIFIFSLMVGLSFVLHGFNPILLVKR